MDRVPSRQTARRAGTAVAAAGLAALALSACDTDGMRNLSQEAVTAQTITAPVAPVASTTPIAPGTFDGSVGDCVSLSGVVSAPVIAQAECGSMDSNFKVVDIAANHNQCIADADMWYANTRNGSEVRAYCLDVDWVTGDCLTVQGDWPLPRLLRRRPADHDRAGPLDRARHRRRQHLRLPRFGRHLHRASDRGLPRRRLNHQCPPLVISEEEEVAQPTGGGIRPSGRSHCRCRGR